MEDKNQQFNKEKVMSHTPGPWESGRSDMATLVDGVQSKWIYAGEQYVAIASGHIDGDWRQVIANARLIAAAPNMLNALETIFGMSSVLPDDKYFREFAVGMCQNAIAKATGEHV